MSLAILEEKKTVAKNLGVHMDVTDLVMLAIAVISFGVGLFLYWTPPGEPRGRWLGKNRP